MNVRNDCTNARLTRIHDPYVSCMYSSHITPNPVSCYFYLVIRIMFLGSCRCIYYILGHTRRHDVYSRTSYCNIPPTRIYSHQTDRSHTRHVLRLYYSYIYCSILVACKFPSSVLSVFVVSRIVAIVRPVPHLCILNFPSLRLLLHQCYSLLVCRDALPEYPMHVLPRVRVVVLIISRYSCTACDRTVRIYTLLACGL